MIQIRNVPDELHRRVKARAAMSGVSLSDYLLTQTERLAALPTEEELLQTLRSREPLDMPDSSAVLIRQDRDSA